MITIEKLIHKIEWDDRECPSDYSLYYIDRITNKKMEIKFTSIKEIVDGVMLLKINDIDTQIPLHRIREVRKNNVVVWERKIK
jgi:uncharacterized protein (UPF0248 family)